MATGSPDYWPSKYALYELADKLDALDGTMDGKLDLEQLNASDVHAELVKVVGNLDGTLGTLKTSIDELIGVHEDTTSMVAYGEEDWDGYTTAGLWVLVSDVNDRRNMLLVKNLSDQTYNYSRDGGSTVEGSIAPDSEVVFYSSAGVWLWCGQSGKYWTAHEEWAT